MTVRPIAAADTYGLRHRILRPGAPPEAVALPGDDHPQGLHVGAFVKDERGEERLVGIATVFPEPPPDEHQYAIPTPAFRLRGMATEEQARGTGAGRALLESCVAHCEAHGARAIWCNARSGARGFYDRTGFAAVGAEFDIAGIGSHFVMWRGV